jgi:hypothetical protein
MKTSAQNIFIAVPFHLHALLVIRRDMFSRTVRKGFDFNNVFVRERNQPRPKSNISDALRNIRIMAQTKKGVLRDALSV